MKDKARWIMKRLICVHGWASCSSLQSHPSHVLSFYTNCLFFNEVLHKLWRSASVGRTWYHAGSDSQVRGCPVILCCSHTTGVAGGYSVGIQALMWHRWQDWELPALAFSPWPSCLSLLPVLSALFWIYFFIKLKRLAILPDVSFYGWRLEFTC